MGPLDRLSTLRRLADILAFFGLEDSAGVVPEHGDAILALWAREVALADAARPEAPEAERLAGYRAALRAAYEAVARPARRGARGWILLEGGAADGPARRAT